MKRQVCESRPVFVGRDKFFWIIEPPGAIIKVCLQEERER